MKKVIIAGAGCTLADCDRTSPTKKPPLDRGFFDRRPMTPYASDLRMVADYIKTHYGQELTAGGFNSLERVIAILYADIFGGALETQAFEAFRRLIRVFLRRLANTTNPLKPSPRRPIYRLLSHSLEEVSEAEDLTIITFNQDIHLEKTLLRLSTAYRWRRRVVFEFPDLYGVEFTNTTRPQSTRIFPESSGASGGVSLLKLHGSLNWYSVHDREDPSREELFDPAKNIYVTRRTTLDHTMKYREKHTFPIVVPPVIHKAQVLHDRLKPSWEAAEVALKQADEVVIVGYSCPVTDWESANLISRSLVSKPIRVSVIDPDPAVVIRYQSLGNLGHLSYFRTVSDYLTLSRR